MTPAETAAKEIAGYYNDHDADNIASVAAAIREAYAERDAAVAELVAMASRAANELAVRGVKCQGLQAALARLEGEQ